MYINIFISFGVNFLEMKSVLIVSLLVICGCDHNGVVVNKKEKKTHLVQNDPKPIMKKQEHLFGAWKIDSVELSDGSIESYSRFEGYRFTRTGNVYLFERKESLTKQVLIGSYLSEGNLLTIRQKNGVQEKWNVQKKSNFLIMKCMAGVAEFKNMCFFMTNIKW